MRMLATLLVPLLLSACATGMGGGEDYMSAERRLAEDCRKRGGILAPTGQQSGRPENDNVCKITGQPSTLTRPN